MSGLGSSLVWADAWFVAPVAALLFGLVALGPLGAQVLARGVVFIDLAVAQAAAAAALWVSVAIDHPSWWVTQALAAAGAMGCAVAVAALARRWPLQREALLGLLYVLGASAALLGAQQDPHGRERLAQLLAADVLWAGSPQVLVLAGCAAAVALLRQRLGRDAVFYPVFAAVASLAVPVLGLFVVFAALISPALWQRAGLRASAALALGAAACAAGLAASWFWDAPSGACVAAALSLAGLCSAWRVPQAGKPVSGAPPRT